MAPTIMSKTINLICKYQICAGHRLYRPDWSPEKNNQVYGKCTQNHGHQYQLELILTGEISSETGMLVNAFDVEKIIRPFIDQNFDHKFLNEDVPFFKKNPPTAEWIAIWIFEELKSKFIKPACLKTVRLHETHEVAAEYPVL